MDKNKIKSIKELLKENNFKIATAESCTGGLISAYITSIPGSSSIFDGSIVAYSNSIKNKLLGVDNEKLEKFGAVSKEVVSDMLDGINKIFKSDFSVAVSGIAGPSGGTKNKPVGTVVIGIKDNFGSKDIQTFYFKGDRESIRIQSVDTALEKILKKLQKI